jgi:AmmeMemoRadiSam system protein A
MNNEQEIIALGEREEAELIAFARQGVSAAVKGIRDVEEALEGKSASCPLLNESRGIFVTLKQGGTLRGCIGTLQTEEPLYRAVVTASISAAARDPRFQPLSEEELEGTDIEISILSPFGELDDIEGIVVGEHGLYIQKGYHAGLLLPQVAVEYGWNRTEFLEQCCRKAGLETEDWKDEDTRIMIFSAHVFGEGKDA